MSEAMIKASDLDGLMRVAEMLGKAGPMLPAHIKSPGEALAVIMAGAELGIPPMASLRTIHLVKGKVGMDYSLMIGLLRKAGYGVQWVAKSGTRCELMLTHRDGTTHTEVWDVERAKQARLWGQGTWAQYPEAMLTARCVSSAARAFAGDVLAGCYSMDEVREISGGTASVGGSDVHVAEVIPEAQTYANEVHAHERDRAAAEADAYFRQVAPALEEQVKRAVQEMQECAEVGEQDAEAGAREAEEVTANHRSQIAAWCAVHRDRIADMRSHPATEGAFKKVWTRLAKWATAAHVPVDDVRAMLSGREVAA